MDKKILLKSLLGNMRNAVIFLDFIRTVSAKLSLLYSIFRFLLHSQSIRRSDRFEYL